MAAYGVGPITDYLLPGGAPRGKQKLAQAILESDLFQHTPVKIRASDFLNYPKMGNTPFMGSEEALARMDPQFVHQMMNEYARLASEYDFHRTLGSYGTGGGLGYIEPTRDVGTYAHVFGENVANEKAPYSWGAGFTDKPLEHIATQVEHDIAEGWNPGRVINVSGSLGDAYQKAAVNPIQNLAAHEFGHAQESHLRKWLTENAMTKQEASDLFHEYHDLLDQVIVDNAAPANKVNALAYSDYASHGLSRNLTQEIRDFGDGNMKQIAAKLARGEYLDAKDLYPLTMRQKARLASEPIAEGFAAAHTGMEPLAAGEKMPQAYKNAIAGGQEMAQMVDDARAVGYIGAADLPTLLKGVGGGAAFLAAPYLINKVLPKEKNPVGNKMAQWALQGAGIGSLLGPEGTATGAGIGALLSQVL